MTLWFVIYMTVAGWRVAPIQPVPGLEAGCYMSNPGSEFCIVSTERRAEKTATKRAEW